MNYRNHDFKVRRGGWDHGAAKGTYGSLSWRNQRSFWTGIQGFLIIVAFIAIFGLAIWHSITVTEHNQQWFQEQLEARGLTVHHVGIPWTSGPFWLRKGKHDRVYYAETSDGTYWVMFSSWYAPDIRKE